MQLEDRDIATLEALQTHGPLASHYLFQLTKHLAKDETYQRKRLLAMTALGLVKRPMGLNDGRVHTDFKVYKLDKGGKNVLERVGKLNRYAKSVGGDDKHNFMTAAITANIEYAARDLGYAFIAAEQILSHPSCAARTEDNPLAIPAHVSYRLKNGHQTSDAPVIPDQIFGINYGEGERYFAVETDCDTETVEPSSSLKRNTILRKYLAYHDVIHQATAKKRFGIPNFIVLFVTVRQSRVVHMVEVLKKHFPSGVNNMLFAVHPDFDYETFRTARFYPGIFTTPWQRWASEHGKGIAKPLDISKA